MARKPTRPKIGIKVEYSEQKIVLHTKEGRECIIKPILIDGARFEFEYMHMFFVFKQNTLVFEAYDKLGISLSEYGLTGDVRELLFSYAQMMISCVQEGYKSRTKGFEPPFTAQIHMFDEVPRR